MNSNLICLAKITKPHGIRGQVKLISYTEDPKAIFNYPHLYDEKMNIYTLKFNSQNLNMFVVNFNKNISRNIAEEVAGTNLYITREMLPNSNENEYYHADLKDILVLDSEQNIAGHIIEIHNFGADDVIEMKILDSKETIFLPFNQEFILELNLEKRSLVFDFANSGIEYKIKPKS